jgi:hypothetical protein
MARFCDQLSAKRYLKFFKASPMILHCFGVSLKLRLPHLVFLLIASLVGFFPGAPVLAQEEKMSENEAAARSIVSNALAAMGGSAALSRVRTLTMLGMTHVSVGENEAQGAAKYTFLRPNKYRVDVDLPSLKVTQAFNGTSGWGMENLKPYPPEINQKIALSMQVALTRGLLALLRTGAPQAKMRIVSREEVDGAKADVVDFDDGAGNTTRFYFDRTTSLPLRAVYPDIDAEGNPIETTDVFFNYRRVGIIRWPHRVVEYQAGMKKREDIFTEIRFNPRIEESFFEPVAP